MILSTRPTRRSLLMYSAVLLLTSLLLSPPLRAERVPLGPFKFCYGLERGGSPTVLRDLGLNTLYIDLLPADMGDLQPCRELIRSASQSGLKVIVGLPTCLTDRYRVSPRDARYTGSVTELITYYVSSLKDEAGLTAWATGHSLEKSLSYTDADFRAYLEAGYPSLDALNASWSTSFATWMQVTMAAARETDAAQPFRVGRASVDLAEYQGRTYHDVMALWLRTIREADAQRPVLTGRVTLYRSLASIPDGYDVVCLSMPPDVVESDLITHNVQALDLARRGGKFHVLQVLRVPSRTSPAYTDESLRVWLQEAALHGAVGFALEDWALVGEVYESEINQPNRKWRRLMNALTACRQLRFDMVPQPTAAIVYSPYAEGLAVTGQPLYGYMNEYLPGEPSNLIYALRMGTRYGPVDYLTLADLETANLARYGALLLPACLRLPPLQEGLLDEYVRAGGAVLADLGLGMYDTGSWTALPPSFMRTAGLAQIGETTERALDLTVSTPLPGLVLPRALKSHGTFSPTTGQTGPANERKPFTISGPVAEVKLSEEGVPLATASVRFDKDRKPVFSGLMGRQSGSGIALFATHPLWQYWPLTDPLSQALHAALLSRRAGFELVQSGLLAGSVQLSASADDVLLLNLDRQPALAEAWAYAAAGRAWSNAINSFSAAPVLQGYPAGTVLVTTAVPGQDVARLARLPLVVQPYAEGVMVQVLEYAPGRVALKVCGAGAAVSGSPARGLEARGGTATEARVVLSAGAYPVAPRSRHQVTIRTRGGQESKAILAASERGELDLSGHYREETLTVVPAP